MSLPANPSYSDLSAAFDTYGAMRQPYAFQDTVEEVPLGVFVLTEVNVQEEQQGATMELVGVDRSIRVQKAQWVDPFPIAAGTNLATAIDLVLTSRWPGVDVLQVHLVPEPFRCRLAAAKWDLSLFCMAL